jgi:hypothetical protein
MKALRYGQKSDLPYFMSNLLRQAEHALREHNAAVLTTATTGDNTYYTGQEAKHSIDPTDSDDRFLLVDHLVHTEAIKEIGAQYPLIPIDLDEIECSRGQLLLFPR